MQTAITETELLSAVKTSPAQRVVDTFTHPSRAMRLPFLRYAWLLPFLMTAVVSYAFSGVIIKRVGLDQVVANYTNTSGVSPGTAAASVDGARRVAVQTLKISMAATPVITLAASAVVACVLNISLNFILGGTAAFADVFTVVMYATLIQDVKPVAAIIALFLDDNPARFDIRNPVATNLGYFASNNISPSLKYLLSSLDITTIWYLAVLAIGCAIVAKTKLISTTVTVYLWWLIIVFCGVAWSVVTANLSQS
jgi:hypothetical protein